MYGPTEAHYAGQRVLFESREGVLLVYLGSDDHIFVVVFVSLTNEMRTVGYY